MKFFLLPVAFMAAGALAQQSSTACAADYIVEACLGTERSKLASCAGTDYECLCAGHKSLITCYNNCPNDVRVKDAQGQRDIFCGYASQFPSKTTKIIAPSQTGTPAQQTPAAGKSEETPTESEPSKSSSSSPATNSNSAAYLALNAGGVLAAVAGVVAVVL
ncbi:hypothetical protein QBC38DRAFT_109412 [Podospora fimiseda]|uniref:Extracellular membrane protein CFEM domain-containing protein n=1 Tax=Podospora fimiseda TaxID=252190 RepID=A0AAN7BTQ6_9PEZI|nr:hypothetical protein QBC38DRAFT_109412 [Podospora fimiseda]